ncbi:spore coat protein [Brevibacillus brevis]|uniref:Spore coat protein n=1 Tax=Brevibacillus brevis TaxID=1393 RepID=A0ABY9TBB1_BREBE|nr:spore coat protein [Brevibacillus brevis]WNC16476.1 spore coat protein [Brevibacillus brevis]
MHTHPYGAHEVIELHEVLNGAIDAINTAYLYAPFIRDPELMQVAHHQLQFMQGEYNSLVYTVQGLGAGEQLAYRPVRTFPTAGIAQAFSPQAGVPQPNPGGMDDRDVASVLLSLHKNGAKLKMAAALEAGHPQIRDLLLQGAVNCAHQAYEVWGYMQRKGYYMWAAMPEAANAQLLRGYQPLRSPGEAAQQPAKAVPAESAAEKNPVSAQLMREAAGPGRVEPMEQPLTPVNAAPAFSPSSYRQEYEGTEGTSLAAEAVQTQGVEMDGAIYQQTEGKQTRSRKKNPISDSPLG